MLESLPALTSLASVICFTHWKKKGAKKFNGWLVASGLFLGLTAASKYLYCIVGIAILVDWVIDARQANRLRKSIPTILSWGLIALVVFFAFDPYLWTNPVGKLRESVLYHAAYAAGASEIQNTGYPLWQPLVWLNMSPYDWHPQAFYFAIDSWITLLAAFGLAGVWKKQRIYVLWFIIGLLFLLLWPTKWPQYIVIYTAPLSLFAAEGLMTLIVRPILAWLARICAKKAQIKRSRFAHWRQVLPWLIPGMITFIILTLLPLIFQVGVSLTDFSVTSLRDGFHGGLWREIWGGLTGQIRITPLQFQNRSSQVNYTGWGVYSPVMGFITSNGILVFNLIWTALSVLIQTGLGLGVALLLWQRGVRFGKFWQTIFILPWAIPEMIGAVMWLNIFMPEWGWLALAVQKYGPHFPFAFFVGWEQSTNLWLLVFLIPAIWYGFPFMMLASSVGLKMIPPDVLDAAAIDGAGAWDTFRFVIWHLLLPLILPAVIIRSIFAFNQFYLFQAFGYTSGTLATLSYNIFNPTANLSGVNGGMFSVSAVVNIITVIILAGFAILFNRWSKAGEGVTYV
jgi:ABC-type sugar transport system permease subunit